MTEHLILAQSWLGLLALMWTDGGAAAVMLTMNYQPNIVFKATTSNNLLDINLPRIHDLKKLQKG